MNSNTTESSNLVTIIEEFTEATNVSFCNDGGVGNLTFFYVWFIGIFFCIFFIVVQKRSQHCQQCCYGRPGLPVPVDLLVSPRNRFMYTILFGVMGISLVNSFNTIDSRLTNIPGNNIYLSTFNKMFWSPFITVSTLVLEFFPLFTAVEFPYRRIGYVAGTIYAMIWFAFEWVPHFVIYYNYGRSCGRTSVDSTLIALTVFKDGPTFVLSVIVVAWFIYMMIFHCFWKPCHKKEVFADLGDLDDPCKGIRQYHLDRVKALLKKNNLGDVKNPSIAKRALNFLFPFQRNYKLPLPLLGVIFAMVMIIYQLTISFIIVASFIFVQLRNIHDNLLEPIFLMNRNYFRTAIVVSDILSYGIPVLLLLSPVLAVLLCIFLLIHMIASISRDIKRVAKYGFKGRLPPPHRRLGAFWKFLGAQVGLFVVAWIMYFAIVLLILLAVTILGVLLYIKETRAYFFTVVVTVGIPLVWSQLLLVGQTLISKFLFLGDRKEDSKFIPVNHKRIYNLFGFVLFFYNGFAGLVSAVIRIVFNIIFGVLFLFRLDVQSLPAHLWAFDLGHKSYLGFIYLDYCYNNAVMHVFCHLLANSITRDKALNTHDENSAEKGGDGVDERPRNKRARNRWLVAYTLIKNPSLQRYTANNIELLAKEKEMQENDVFWFKNDIIDVTTDWENMKSAKVHELDVEVKMDLGKKAVKKPQLPHLYPSLSVNRGDEDDSEHYDDKFHKHKYTRFS